MLHDLKREVRIQTLGSDLQTSDKLYQSTRKNILFTAISIETCGITAHPNQLFKEEFEVKKALRSNNGKYVSRKEGAQHLDTCVKCVVESQENYRDAIV